MLSIICRAFLICLLVLTCLHPAPAQTAKAEAFIRFEEVAQQSGLDYRNLFGAPDKLLIIESTGNGAAWFDFDNDGWLDLFVVNGSTLELQAKGQPGPGNRLYRNQGNGTFTDVTSRAGLRGGYWGSGVAAGDFDNDGWVDLYVTAILEPNHLYHNNGDGTFTDVTATAGVGDGKRAATSAAFFDYDKDGDLDLFVINYVTFDRTYLEKVSPYCFWKGLRVFCGPVGVPGDSNTLFRNNGNGTFTDVTKKAGLANPELKSLGVVVADFDGDSWPDLYVSADSTTNAMYRNKGDGTFDDVTWMSGTGFSQDGRAQAGMGVDAGDYDSDGRLDIFVLNFQDDDNTLYHNDGGMVFTDATFSARLGQVSFSHLGWGTGFRDLDNDGWLDLFVANGHVYPQVDAPGVSESYRQQNQVFRNDSAGHFIEVTSQAGPGLKPVKSSRGIAFGDYDNDGRMDLVVVNMDDTLDLLHNTTDSGNHWLLVKTVGTRSNRDGVGARIRLKAGDHMLVREINPSGSFASSNDPRAHFGLGTATKADWLEVTWPSGKTQKFENLAVDRVLVVNEDQGLLK